MTADTRRPTSAAERLHRELAEARVRLTLVAVAVVLVVLVATGLALVTVQWRVLTEAIDEGLRDRADELEISIERASDNVQLPSSTTGDSLTQIVTLEGEVVAASADAIAGEAIATIPEGREHVGRVTLLGEGEPFRVLSRRVEASGGTVVIHVANTFDDVEESVSVLRRSLLVAIPLATLLLAALVWWLTGRTLRRVEASGLHQQRFVADASHELRSPLARMRAQLEVELRDPTHADARSTLQSVLADAIEMQRLVDDLLFLARRDAGADAPASDQVDLDDVVFEEARRVRERQVVEVDVSGVSAARVRGDADELARMVRNLAENAEQHARGTVTFSLETRGATVQMAVADDGPGVSPRDRDHIFDRFVRADDARSRIDGGTGIGLAIVHEIVTRAGGTVAVEDGVSGGARFVVRLPAETGG